MSLDESEYRLIPWTSFDPFAPPGVQIREYDLRFTAVEGLSQNPCVDVSKTFRLLKKKFGCGGAIMDDPELGEIILLQGDHRSKLEKFFSLGTVVPDDTMMPIIIEPIDFRSARPRTTLGLHEQKRLKSAANLTLFVT